jgi:hypothetical protein
MNIQCHIPEDLIHQHHCTNPKFRRVKCVSEDTQGEAEHVWGYLAQDKTQLRTLCIGQQCLCPNQLTFQEKILQGEYFSMNKFLLISKRNTDF